MDVWIVKKRKSILFKCADDSDDNIFDVKPTKKRVVDTKLTNKPKGKAKVVVKTSTKLERIQPSNESTTSHQFAGPTCSETNISDIDEQLYEYRLRIGEIDAQIAELQAGRVSLVKSMRKLHRQQQLLQAPLETSETTNVAEVTTRIFKRHALPSMPVTSVSNWWRLNQQMEDFDQTIENLSNVDVLLSPRITNSVEAGDSTSNETSRSDVDSDSPSGLLERPSSLKSDSNSAPELIVELLTKLTRCIESLPCSHVARQELANICQRGLSLCSELQSGSNVASADGPRGALCDAEATLCSIDAASESPDKLSAQEVCGEISDEAIVGAAETSMGSSAAPLVGIVSQESTYSSPTKTVGFDIDLSGLIASSPPSCSKRESCDATYASGRARTRLSLISDVFRNQEASPAPLISQCDTACPVTMEPERSSFEDNQEEYIFHYSPSRCADETSSSPAALTSCGNYNDDDTVLLCTESPSDKENDAHLHAKQPCDASGGEFTHDLKSYTTENEILLLSTPVLKSFCSNYGLKTTNREFMQNALVSLWRRLKNISPTQTASAVSAPSSHRSKCLITIEDVTKCLKSQKDIYEKIVSFIPIEVSDVQRRLASQGWMVSIQTLKDMLDSLGVFVAVRQELK